MLLSFRSKDNVVLCKHDVNVLESFISFEADADRWKLKHVLLHERAAMLALFLIQQPITSNTATAAVASALAIRHTTTSVSEQHFSRSRSCTVPSIEHGNLEPIALTSLSNGHTRTHVPFQRPFPHESCSAGWFSTSGDNWLTDSVDELQTLTSNYSSKHGDNKQQQHNPIFNH